MAKINDIKNIIGAKAHPVLKVTAEATVLKEEQKIASIPINEVPGKPERESLRHFLKPLIKGVDYGNIPGVQGDVLFKAGALKILRFLKLKYSVILLDKTVSATDKFISYTVKVDIINLDGEIIYESIGAANSLERKFEKTGFSSDNLLCRMATKRALVVAVKEMIQ